MHGRMQETQTHLLLRGHWQHAVQWLRQVLYQCDYFVLFNGGDYDVFYHNEGTCNTI